MLVESFDHVPTKKGDEFARWYVVTLRHYIEQFSPLVADEPKAIKLRHDMAVLREKQRIAEPFQLCPTLRNK